MSKGNSTENSPNFNTNGNITDGSTDSEWRTGHINGNNFRNKEVKYRMINGMAVFEGDIILAKSPEEIEKLSPEPKVPSEHEPTVKPIVRAIVRKGEQFRWPRGEIPYVIQSTLPDQQRINDAIRHWEERTPIRFIQRNENNAAFYPNYVSFRQYVPQPNERQEEIFHCSSPIGMQNWGEQSIILWDKCVTGDVIHEIGHTVGLWHEQSREDRDDFIRIIWDNVDPKYKYNFSQHIADGDDIGEYDYCSIMHYGAWFFSKGQGLATIEPIKPLNGCELGQKNGLSDGDIAAVTEMYGNLTPTIQQNTDGRIEAFSIGSDGKLSHKKQKSANSNEWEPSNTKQGNQEIQNWSSLGLEQKFFSSGQRPAIVRGNDGRLDVFWLNDNYRYHSYQDKPDSKWSNTSGSEVGGVDFEGDPVVAQNANGSLEVFMVHEEYSSNQYRLHHMSRDGASLPSLGGRWSPNARPIVAVTSDSRLVVFMIGQDRQLYYRWQGIMNSSQWSEDWTPLGGPSPTDPPETRLGDPAVANGPGDALYLFVVNSKDGQVHYRWQTNNDIDTNAWSRWNPLSEGNWSPRKRIAVAKNQDGRLEVFMVGTDRRLYHIWQTAYNNTTNLWDWFMNWVPLGKELWPLSSNPAVAKNQDGRLEVFMVGTDKRLYHRWQTAPNNSSQWSGSWIAL